MLYSWIDLIVYVQKSLDYFKEPSSPPKVDYMFKRDAKFIFMTKLFHMDEPKKDDSIKKLLEDIIHLNGIDVPLNIYNDFEQFFTLYVEDRCQSDVDNDTVERF
ncbi:hypothetical protein ACH5RR_007196 [Cinchona calisaya]|uniref:Uncharacterized protein n=1 Tax=Cinchona calisaya TaxID=153742 RepID=A0ABD3AR86_9GENT